MAFCLTFAAHSVIRILQDLLHPAFQSEAIHSTGLNPVAQFLRLTAKPKDKK